MYVVKCKDLIETAPKGFPTWLLSGRWEAFVIKYATLDKAIDVITKQVTKPQTRPQPKRAYRVFEEDGRKLKLVFSLEPR